MDWWHYENAVLDDGWQLVCGVDEAGRGCLAGPVFAAAVILPRGLEIEGLNDSKKVPPKKREALYDIIVERAVTYAVASASEAEIDDINILNATYLAMNRAIAQLEPQAEIALIDGNRSKGIRCINRCIIGGDGKSASIAAASILAKVSRDRYMTALSEEYPEYQFAQHKGYCTEIHCEAIHQYGPSPVHRMTFLRKLGYNNGMLQLSLLEETAL
jgi:ribonuclease HII